MDMRGGARAVFFQGEAGEAATSENRPHVIHEGRRIRIRTYEFYRDQAVMLPLRSGFPIHSNDRVSPIYCVYSENGVRVGHAIKLEFGLRVYFDSAAPAGDYYFLTSTITGRA